MSVPCALVLLAPGAEEIETVAVVDVLRRAEIEVVLAGVDGPEAVRCSRGVVLVPDAALADVEGPFDAVVLPGGAEGSRAQEAGDRWLAAIGAAPFALVAAGVGAGRRLTSHPSVRATLEAHGCYDEGRVVREGHLLTSRGPGSAIEFALALVGELRGRDVARRVAAPMMLPRS